MFQIVPFSSLVALCSSITTVLMLTFDNCSDLLLGSVQFVIVLVGLMDRNLNSMDSASNLGISSRKARKISGHYLITEQ